MDAPIIDEIGRILLEPNGKTILQFGLINRKPSKVQWSFDQGFYPSVVYEFDIPDFKAKIKYFAHTRKSGVDALYVILYERVILTYTGTQTSGSVSVSVGVPDGLTPVNQAAKTAGSGDATYQIGSGKPLTLDYAVAAERLSGSGDHNLSAEKIQEIAGDVDSVETAFKNFWKGELDSLTRLIIPSTVQNANHIVNAHNTALVHMQIIHDGNTIPGGKCLCPIIDSLKVDFKIKVDL